MSPAPPEVREARWEDAARVASLLAVDPVGLGGVRVRAGPGPARDRFCAWVGALAPPGAPNLRLPAHVTEDRLLGGLALAETLRTGRLVVERGLLGRADGGLLFVAMAERLESHVVSHLCAALDRGVVALEREGLTDVVPCRVGVVALDEGIDDEAAAPALCDRLAFSVALDALGARDAPPAPERGAVERARAALDAVEVGVEALEALCAAAVVLGVGSTRAPLLAARAARANAALEGRGAVEAADVAAAARLVLGPRATRLPEAPADEDDAPEPPPPAGDDAPEDEAREAEGPPQGPMADVVLEAARSGIPAGLLDALGLGAAARGGPRRTGRSGARRVSTTGGRAAGTVAGAPGHGERLAVVETLRAAAPWQRLRARPGSGRRVEVRRDDFRVRRFRERLETSVIFAVDASGSSALQRLAEAKGAVEQVLADCYVRRDHVALVAFRGERASLLLPPTRSLARARRLLAGLAGGGPTPLAAGIDAALALALDARRRGRTPLVVLMTDGRANVARDGGHGAPRAMEDALASARAVREAGVSTLFLDTAPRPREAARAVARAMDARYLPLPYLDAGGVSREVQRAAREAPPRP